MELPSGSADYNPDGGRVAQKFSIKKMHGPPLPVKENLRGLE
jgi:hypothetical protein